MAFVIQSISCERGSVKTIQSEAIRYLGYGKNKSDLQAENLITECKNELESILSAKACYTRVPVCFGTDSLNLGFGDIQSKALRKNLTGCSEAWLFAATIGLEADRLIAKTSRVSPAKSVIIDALASSAIEWWCDEINRKLCADEHCRPRFSPGYGDFDLGFQKNFLALLNTNIKIGLTLTESMLMAPSKSVTAVIGIGERTNIINEPNICTTCKKQDCLYKE